MNRAGFIITAPLRYLLIKYCRDFFYPDEFKKALNVWNVPVLKNSFNQ